MIKIDWAALKTDVTDFIETEEWVQVPDNKKQQMLLDLKDPENMETTLRYSPGCDMIMFKIYRPNGLTKMNKLVRWVFIPGVAKRLELESE